MSEMRSTNWPDWWEWELEFTSHVLKRMDDRRFNETDLRLMMSKATACREDLESGRWLIETVHDSRSWEVIVEPDVADELLVVITAYCLDSP